MAAQARWMAILEAEAAIAETFEAEKKELVRQFHTAYDEIDARKQEAIAASRVGNPDVAQRDRLVEDVAAVITWSGHGLERVESGEFSIYGGAAGYRVTGDPDVVWKLDTSVVLTPAQWQNEFELTVAVGEGGRPAVRGWKIDKAVNYPFQHMLTYHYVRTPTHAAAGVPPALGQ